MEFDTYRTSTHAQKTALYTDTAFKSHDGVQMSGVLSKDQHCVLTVLNDVFDCLFTNAVIV